MFYTFYLVLSWEIFVQSMMKNSIKDIIAYKQVMRFDILFITYSKHYIIERFNYTRTNHQMMFDPLG